jgi:Mrp family chromosome partitioning ATPase
MDSTTATGPQQLSPERLDERLQLLTGNRIEDHLTRLDTIAAALDQVWAGIMLNSKLPPKTVMICGATPGEGASFLSFYLALFLVRKYGLKVLYVDMAAGAPSNSTKDVDGHSSEAVNHHPLASLVVTTGVPGFSILPAGIHSPPENHSTALAQKYSLEELIRFCSDNFDIAIFDGQPILQDPSTVTLAKLVERVFLVCRYGRSRREVSKHALDKLSANGVQVAGAILNQREYPVPGHIYDSIR